ncbi:MAG: DUF3800 domain-containing protein [Opitutales bacterium]|jgi:hypothetical protein|nr:DUF3800 domain-containing protein [Opitutales bacterium]MDP4788216.1 DUF3800 domain-containing protein [Opitutales bacterium]MDP4893950.1 DUF3800 domain-containing protein [Opitutales bacterium]
MHFLYVDESGDVGSKHGSSSHFILCGVLVHHADWHRVRKETRHMRSRLCANFGFPEAAELHASELLSRTDRHFNLSRRMRLRCAAHVLGFIEARPAIRRFRTVIDKDKTGEDCYLKAWMGLLSEVTAEVGLFRHGHCSSPGLVIVCDDHRTAPRPKMMRLVDPLSRLDDLLVDLPFGLASQDSHMLQMADLLAYLSKQTVAPSGLFVAGVEIRLLERCERLFRSAGES